MGCGLSRKHFGLALLLRALSLLVFAELSGLSHAALDVSCALAGSAHGAEDCEDGESGHECPPGCPNCHCWHAGLASPQMITAAVELEPELPRPADVAPPAYAQLRVKAPDLSSLYRPPRARA